MTIWEILRERIIALGGGALLDFFAPSRPPERSEGFAMAVVALGAKMAKSDGRVTKDEVRSFREVFQISDDDLPNVGRLFDLAREDVAGFDLYASRIARMFKDREDVLETLLDGLFYIARADGILHENEMLFLRAVADIFGISEAAFERIHLRNLPDSDISPYAMLGVTLDMTLPEIRQVWKKLAAHLHPDRLQGEGIPQEALRLSERRLAEINAAFEEIKRARQPIIP